MIIVINKIDVKAFVVNLFFVFACFFILTTGFIFGMPESDKGVVALLWRLFLFGYEAKDFSQKRFFVEKCRVMAETSYILHKGGSNGP